MWSERLRRGCAALGHTSEVVTSPEPGSLPAGDLAILNLGNSEWPLAEIVSELKARDCAIVAHAGHKEKELLALGRSLGVDRLATNSELTHKLAHVLGVAQ